MRLSSENCTPFDARNSMGLSDIFDGRDGFDSSCLFLTRFHVVPNRLLCHTSTETRQINDSGIPAEQLSRNVHTSGHLNNQDEAAYVMVPQRRIAGFGKAI